MKTGLHRMNLPLTLAIAGFISLLGFLFLMASQQSVTKGGTTKKSRADLIKSSLDQQLEKFSLTGFDNEGKKFWKLEGEAATINPSQTVYLDQNVTLKLKDTTVIRTDHVQWSQDGGTMRTNSPVTVDHPTAKIKGIGAIGRPSESFIQLNRNIEMLLNATTKLTCEGPMKLFYKESKMVFYRKVKVVDEKGVLTANRMDVHFDEAKKKIDQIVAIGNVVIQRGVDTTHSQRVIYTLATGSIRLEGNPEITLHKESQALLDATIRS